MTFSMRTIWRPGPVESPRYVKYDGTGTLINVDKFKNFRNYYWTGVSLTPTDLPQYNSAGLPEYYVIEKGGNTNWSIYNFWTHVSSLKKHELGKYSQATRPIIEFNKNLEGELLSRTKLQFNQRPKFTLWRRDQIELYKFNDGVTTNLTDEYCQQELLVDLEDIPNIAKVIENDEQLLSQTFTFGGRRYIQSLVNSYYQETIAGITYPYNVLIASQPENKGTLLGLLVSQSSFPQVITLTWNSSLNGFTSESTVIGVGPTCPIGVVTQFAGVTIKPATGLSPLENGDTWVLHVKTPAYQREFLYIALNGAPRTLSTPEKILDADENFRVNKGSVVLRDGIWEVPPQLKWNVQNETRSEISLGDLYLHFSSIIEAQPNLDGSSTGDNNWRNIRGDVGLGGKIKQHDGDVALFISTLLQEGVSHPALIEFAKQSYRSLFAELKLFTEDELPTLIVSGEFNPNSEIVDADLLQLFKQYLSKKSTVVESSPTTLDDNIATAFYDSTSSLSNLVVTLPYLGLVAPVQPKIELDLELNMNMLIHHDGHRTELSELDDDVLKRLVQKRFKRSSGQETPGEITGFSAPTKPYRGQFWYKTATAELFFYDVISDTGELPLTAQLNDYSFNRQTNEVYKFNGTTWTLLGNSPNFVKEPFRILNLSGILTGLTLLVENELFVNCPPLTNPLNKAALETNPLYDGLMKKEFEAFGVAYGVADVYGAVFDSENPFTWNYSSDLGVATWHEFYKDVYGTSRPDIQPWVVFDITEQNLLDILISQNLIAVNTTKWDISLWSLDVAQLIKTLLTNRGLNNLLSVDVETGALLPPYSTNPESYLSVPPQSANLTFQFNDLGPVELLWTRTLDYLYAQQKTFFKINPLNYVQSTWGIKNTTVGDYTLNTQLSKKVSPSSLQLHGEILPDALSNQITVNLYNPVPSKRVYTIACVSRINNIFKVTGGDITTPVFIFEGKAVTGSWLNVEPYFDLYLYPGRRGFFFGDTFKITIIGNQVTTEIISAKYLKAEGFNQLYVQYLRTYGQDKEISLNRSLFNEWEVKLGYRFDSLINTDLLKIKNENETVPKTFYEVLIKENKFIKSSWINAIRISLVRAGSSDKINNLQVPKAASSTSSPGADWVYRIDVYNPARPQLSWYSFDVNGPVDTFKALDGIATNYSWLRYQKTTTLNTISAPFLITGLQNVLNFIFGYAEKLAEDGWRFNSRDDTDSDPETGRPNDYQLLAEKFLELMFSGAINGTTFVFNPFANRVWFETKRGVVSALNDVIGLEQETVPKLLTDDFNQIPISDVRVFRQDELTEFVFDKSAFTFHLLTSEYEHVALLENYSVNNTLFYDPFLGQVIPYIFLDGLKQNNPSGRLDFGGHFLLGGEMKRNIESSVKGITQLYETAATTSNLPEVERARASLGFLHKDYFSKRETSDQTEFRFWQGMISSKGTNYAVGAYVNSAKYSTASLDEFWAYKIASYGDSRTGSTPEMKIRLDDVMSRQRTPYLFLEKGEKGIYSKNGFDETPIDFGTFDYYSIYEGNTEGVEALFNPNNSVVVSSTDEQRWVSYDDLNSMEYIALELITEARISTPVLNQMITISDKNGKLVRADVFEIVNKSTGVVYYELGQYNGDEFSTPHFTRVNHSTILVNKELGTVGQALFVRAYGPPIKSFSPSQVYNTKSKTLSKDDLVWWDPARGSHHPAVGQVDFLSPCDPATYNSKDTTHRVNIDKVWGEGEVGRVWWNTNELEYQPYSDTKIYPDNNERLNRWGSLAEYSSVNILEWVSSTVPPLEYSGELGVDSLMKRIRTWQQRPVAWKYSANPVLSPRKFLALQPESLEIVKNKAVINRNSFNKYELVLGTKIAGAVYNGLKLESNLTSIFGTMKIVGAQTPILTRLSTSVGGPLFVASEYFDFSAIIDEGAIQFLNDPTGHYQLLNGAGNIVLKHLQTGKQQSIEMNDTPFNGGRDSYNFDLLGIIIEVVSKFGHNAAWPIIGSTDENTRKSLLLTDLTKAHQIVLRYSVDVEIAIPFSDDVVQTLGTFGLPDVNSSQTLPSSVNGWIAWTDPTINPINLTPPPNNQWEPFIGSWVSIGDRLSDLRNDITTRTTDQWVGFNGDSYVPYRFAWSSWAPVVREIRTAVYNNNNNFYSTNFTFDISDSEISKRVKVYVDGVLISKTFYSISNRVVVIAPSKVYLGQSITIILEPQQLTKTQLEFDPEIEDENPLVVDQYKKDHPFVTREGRSDDTKTKTYYFWVKNKETPATSKKLSVKQITNLLSYYGDSYCVPQILKWANQVDGRPNRYAMVYIENLGRYVGEEDAFKIRFKNKPYLRGDSNNSDLKNIHEEWVLIRPYQTNRIPQKLWDIATDTVSGINQIGESLPSPSLALYEERTGTNSSIGPRRGQLLTEVAAARAAVKFSILNTRVGKFNGEVLIPDEIAFSGFSIDQIDNYLKTPESARKFMSDLWRLAKPKQINEIFFAIFEDGVSRNVEMPDFFKTSYIALNDVRTVELATTNVDQNSDLIFVTALKEIIDEDGVDIIDEDGQILKDEIGPVEL